MKYLLIKKFLTAKILSLLLNQTEGNKESSHQAWLLTNLRKYKYSLFKQFKLLTRALQNKVVLLAPYWHLMRLALLKYNFVIFLHQVLQGECGHV